MSGHQLCLLQEELTWLLKFEDHRDKFGRSSKWDFDLNRVFLHIRNDPGGLPE